MNIIIVAGMPASGKTTFVNKLSKALGYPVLEKDAIKEELFELCAEATDGRSCHRGSSAVRRFSSERRSVHDSRQ